jgi:hypothetical protein
MWPAKFPDLNPFDRYLWGTKKTKCIKIIPKLDELKHSICETITSTDVCELKLVSIFPSDLKFVKDQKGDILSTYHGSEFS